MPQLPDYTVMVIGGGHAGAEAAWAAANMLRGEYEATSGEAGRVALVTMDDTKIGAMSCNPAIGGLAKGQIVREIDAMGGLMPLAADATGIQFRVLNASKGPAVRGPRCQSDKYAYASEVQRLLRTRTNLSIIQGRVEDFLINAGRCTGIVFTPRQAWRDTSADCCGDFSAPENDKRVESGTKKLSASAVILTTGTFMRGLMHTGEHKTEGGRVGEPAAVGISATLTNLGFELARLKTGTPPRLAGETIEYAALELQPGDERPLPFSDMTGGNADGDAYEHIRTRFPVIEQRPCWITHTSAAIHDHIRENLDRAPMYNGQIATAGPRYCPSIEDKIVRFPDRSSHHVFLEPESLTSNEIYCNGISTSLPGDVQEQIVRLMPGCEHASILRFGYAVEYDMVPARQLDATCMTKRIAGLFFAGQINGTTGYEEAAGQGLIAGINAVRHARGQSPVRLGRDQAYIGVLMDDLITKVPREPYRMFTSRAEHRLLLRADNAADRLTPMARELGLIDDARWRVYRQRREAIDAIESLTGQHKVDGERLVQWMVRPTVQVDDLRDALAAYDLPPMASDRRVLATVLADVQYAGYVQRQQKQIDQLAAQEHTPLPTDLDFATLHGLRTEAAQTLNQFKPATLGQAGRLAGVNPADLMVVSIALSRMANAAS